MLRAGGPLDVLTPLSDCRQRTVEKMERKILGVSYMCWISTTGFCVVGYYVLDQFYSHLFLFCFSFVSLLSLLSGYHANSYHAPFIPHGLSRPYHHCTAITPVYISRLSRHSIFLLLGCHTRAITLYHTRKSGYHTRHSS